MSNPPKFLLIHLECSLRTPATSLQQRRTLLKTTHLKRSSSILCTSNSIHSTSNSLLCTSNSLLSTSNSLLRYSNSLYSTRILTTSRAMHHLQPLQLCSLQHISPHSSRSSRRRLLPRIREDLRIYSIMGEF